jgi:hypothetical protein
VGVQRNAASKPSRIGLRRPLEMDTGFPHGSNMGSAS